MKIVITGAAGGIGRRVTAALEQAHDLLLVDSVAPEEATVFDMKSPTGRRLAPLTPNVPYVRADIGENAIAVHPSPAHDDGAWIALCSPQELNPLQAIATAVNPHLRVEVEGAENEWTARLVESDAEAKELPEVMVTKVSSGADFVFRTRKSLPLTVV